MEIISKNREKKALSDNRRTLNRTGMRATNQRALVLEIIRQGEGHLDADEVYRRARKKQPQLSLSTVYRALRLFKKKGLIEETHFDEDHHHYEAKPVAEHHHLVCLKCGKIVEFRYPLSRYVKKNVPEARDFLITNTEVRMTGYCPQCQNQK
ncbi:MAG: transcriptional repressor [Chloroflexi bacterium]|nr:transcriptional repressor [Chloroflexota bacterium]